MGASSHPGAASSSSGRHRRERASKWADELAFAVEAARRAGEVIQQGYGNLERIEHKSRRDVVTEIDVRSEELIISAVRERFPGDGILAEESGSHAGTAGTAATRGRTWVIDPLDGTVNYANGIPFYCVSIGLVALGKPVVGVVLDPARADLYAATADGPATLNESEIRASTKDKLGDFVVAMAIIGRGGIGRERRIARSIRISRRMGSAALGLAYVASGRFDAMVQNGGLSVWDVTAAGLIVERAGGSVSGLFGGPWLEMGAKSGTVTIVAAPAPHHARLLELIQQAGTSIRTRRP